MPVQPSGAYGRLGVTDVVIGIGVVHFKSKKHLNALPLVWTQDLL